MNKNQKTEESGMVSKKITLTDLREMVEEYKKYLLNIDEFSKDTLKILILRDEIEILSSRLGKRGTDLSVEKSRLDSLDQIIKDKAKPIFRSLTNSVALLPYREERKIPRSHWWWYLDELIRKRRSLRIKKWAMRGGITAGILVATYVVMVKVFPKPQPATIYQEEGSKFYQEGRIDEAIQAYKKALELNPEDGSTYLMLGVLYEDKKAIEKAAHYFEVAESLYPQKIDFYNARGMVYFQGGKLDRAAAEVKEALKIDPKNPFSNFLLGNVYEAEGRFTEAVTQYQIVSNMKDAPAQLVVMARFKMGMMMQRAPSRSP
ncbi:MAG: tetratricopeptide repeat protein [bacterium]